MSDHHFRRPKVTLIWPWWSQSVVSSMHAATSIYTQRRKQIFSIWCGDSETVLLFPDKKKDHIGVWEDDSNISLNSRHISTYNFFLVLSCWPDFPDSLRQMKDVVMTLPSHNLGEIAKQLFAFYTKIFCSYFKRLPILPCCVQ